MNIRRELLWVATCGAALGTLGLAAVVELSRIRRPAPRRNKGVYFTICRLVDAVGAYRGQPWRLVLALALSIGSHALMVGTFASCAFAIRDGLPVTVHFILDPLAMTLNAVPISPGGLGLAEGAFSFLFSSAGSPNGALVGLIGRALLYFVSLLVALAAFTSGRWVPRAESVKTPARMEVSST